uniref:Uncharacterized protein n=1 Tax=Ascaris lumbricoides TaxID=6252 RepID=A0A9J2Q7M8_ASCLU
MRIWCGLLANRHILICQEYDALHCPRYRRHLSSGLDSLQNTAGSDIRLNSEQERLSALQLKPSDTSSGVGPALSASLHSISKRLSTGENKLQIRKRTAGNAPTNVDRKSRASAGRNSVDRQKRAHPRRGCEEYELPLLRSHDSSARPQEVYPSRSTTSVSRAAASDALQGVPAERSSLIPSHS